MTIGDFESAGTSNPEWVRAVQARFKTLNLGRGLLDAFDQGHKVLLTVCNTRLDPDQTARCAKQAVDQHMAAVVGMAAVYSDRAWPILEAARIAVIGSRVNTIADATSHMSFPIGAGLPGELAAMPQLLAQRGATRIAVIISDFGTATDEAVGFIQRGVIRTSAEAGPVIRVAQGTTSLAPAVAAATQNGVDGIIGFVAGGQPGALAQQLRASNFQGQYVTLAPFGNARLASDAGGSIGGTLVVREFASPSSKASGFEQLRHDIAAFGPVPLDNEGTINFWLSAWMFGNVAQGLTSVSASSVLRALNQLDRFPTGDLTPPLTTTVAEDSTLPRLFNWTVTFDTTDQGQLLPLVGDQFFNVVTGRYATP